MRPPAIRVVLALAKAADQRLQQDSFSLSSLLLQHTLPRVEESPPPSSNQNYERIVRQALLEDEKLLLEQRLAALEQRYHLIKHLPYESARAVAVHQKILKLKQALRKLRKQEQAMLQDQQQLSALVSKTSARGKQKTRKRRVQTGRNSQNKRKTKHH
ncbi:MAG: hypothetical protein QW594_00855 [Candidatus Woesearchaeota archaeon]